MTPTTEISSSKQKTKYTCPSCKANVWGKELMHIDCGDCDVSFYEN